VGQNPNKRLQKNDQTNPTKRTKKTPNDHNKAPPELSTNPTHKTTKNPTTPPPFPNPPQTHKKENNPNLQSTPNLKIKIQRQKQTKLVSPLGNMSRPQNRLSIDSSPQLTCTL